MLKVHILTDDRVRKRGLLSEHGLSLWIEKDDKNILFDTGQTSVYTHNAKMMGINIESVDYVIISHGHYDHCGGLQYIPDSDKVRSVFVHPDAFLKKFAAVNKDEPSKEIGIPFNIHNADIPGKNFNRYIAYPCLIQRDILLSGEIPADNDFEEAPVGFFMEKDQKIVPDLIQDEQMLIIEDEGELAVFLGCSHPGVINCIQYAKKLKPDRKIKLLIAGMHLDNISRKRLDMTVDYLVQSEIKNIIPLHCTGFTAMCEMKHKLGDRCQLLCTGDTVQI